MKYLVIAKKLGNVLRGSYSSAKLFCEWFGEYVDFAEAQKITDPSQLQWYDKIIFRTHGEHQYSIPVNIVSLKDINHLIYTRYDHHPKLYNSCTNGFHYYKNYPEIKNYVPMIYPFKVLNKQLVRPCVGYYSRKDTCLDSFITFKLMLEDLKNDVDLYFMGDIPHSFFKTYPHVKSVKHTYNNIKFFESISHYVIPDSMYDDLFPNSMYEAVQTGKQIISPSLNNRQRKHGINDIKDCIKYHEWWDFDTYYDNRDTILKPENFIRFYVRLFENSFEYSFNRDKYDTFREWIESEVI